MAIAPGITRWIPLPIGELGAAIHDPLEFQRRARERYGDVFRLRAGPMVTHFLYHPDHVSRVLRDQQKNYQRGWQYNLLRRLLGDNLVVSDGPHWMRQRRLAQPAFHRQRLVAYLQMMIDCAQKHLTGWQRNLASKSTVDLAPEMSRLALAIAGRTLFSRDVSHDADAIGTSYAQASRFLEYRLKRPLTSLPLILPTPGNRLFKRSVRTLNDIVLTMIRQRRHGEDDRIDLLSMLMSARDEESGEQMTDEQLCSEALTFLIAGHETSATALTWTFYLLAGHAEIQRAARDEVDVVLGDRQTTIEDVFRLATVRRIVEESLRLYPPVWVVARQAAVEDEIAGFRIPAGSTVALCSYMTHRHPAFWEEPDTFDPNRFTPERSSQRHKGAYFPFLGGPHQCIGHEFAMLEMTLVVAMALQRFELGLQSPLAIRPAASLTLRPSQPILIGLRERSYRGSAAVNDSIR